MHSNVTIKNVSWPHLSWPTLYRSVIALMLLSREGNENIHLMTVDKRQELRIWFADIRGNNVWAKYDHFSMNCEHENYRLTRVGKFTASPSHTGQFVVNT